MTRHPWNRAHPLSPGFLSVSPCFQVENSRVFHGHLMFHGKISACVPRRASLFHAPWRVDQLILAISPGYWDTFGKLQSFPLPVMSKCCGKKLRIPPGSNPVCPSYCQVHCQGKIPQQIVPRGTLRKTPEFSIRASARRILKISMPRAGPPLMGGLRRKRLRDFVKECRGCAVLEP